jgi:hypothetical protein
MKSYLKSFNPVNYLIATVILYLLYTNVIPNDKLPKSVQNIYVFIGLGLLILVFYDLMIVPALSKKSKKNYKNMEHFKKKIESFAEQATQSPQPTQSSQPTQSPQQVQQVVQQSTQLSADQIKNLSDNDRNQLVQSYLLDLYKKTAADPNNGKQVLTEGEIVYYISLFVSNLNNTQKMNEIQQNIQDIQKIDKVRGDTLLKLMNLAKINPDLSLKVAKSAPLKLIDIVNAMDSSLDINKFIVDGSNKKIELDLINLIQTKIANLESTIKKEKDENFLPKALSDIIGKNKYVDSKGMIQDLTYGDLQFNTQLSPGQMQALGSYDSTFNNKWENAYTILNTDKWRPARGNPPVCKQEKVCPVCPTLTAGFPLSVLDFDKSRYVMGPDGISVDYINKLNNPIKP